MPLHHTDFRVHDRQSRQVPCKAFGISLTSQMIETFVMLPEELVWQSGQGDQTQKLASDPVGQYLP